jgi:hypothetical protein
MFVGNAREYFVHAWLVSACGGTMYQDAKTQSREENIRQLLLIR